MKVSPITLIKGFELQESAAATWTTLAIDLATAPENGIGATVRGNDAECDVISDVAPAGAGTESIDVSLLEEYHATSPTVDDEDVISHYRQVVMGNGVDNVNDYQLFSGLVNKFVAPEDGYITLRDKIYVGVISSCAAAKYARGKIYYNLVRLDLKETARYAMREAFE